jgi:hypothetical protein
LGLVVFEFVSGYASGAARLRSGGAGAACFFSIFEFFPFFVFFVFLVFGFSAWTWSYWFTLRVIIWF